MNKVPSIPTDEMEKQLRAEIDKCLGESLKRRIQVKTFLEIVNTIEKTEIISPQMYDLLRWAQREANVMKAENGEYVSFLKAAFKNMSHILQRGGGSRISNIQLISKFFLEEYRRKIRDFLPLIGEDWLPDEKVHDMVNLAVATYLETWLLTDRSTFLTIEKFSQYGYHDDAQDKKRDSAWESKKSAYHRAYAKYNKLHHLQREVEKERGEKSHPAEYKSAEKRQLSLPILAWCESYAEGGLDVLKFLFFKKHLRNRKSAHDSKQNAQIAGILYKFKSMVETIMKSYPKDESDIGAYKAFVAKCIMCHKMERTYRFVLAGRIAEYALKHGCSPDAYNKELFAVYFGVTQGDMLIPMGRKTQLDKNGPKGYTQTHYALNTVGYDEIIESLFTLRDSDSAEPLIQNEWVRRAAIVELLWMLYSVFPYNQRAWKDADFKEAADFFFDDYPILYSLAELEVYEAGEDNEGQKYYDYYHSYYLELLKDERTQTKRIIETMA